MNLSCKCEHEFWKAQPHRTPFADEPIAADSGLIMCLLPLFDSAGLADPPPAPVLTHTREPGCTMYLKEEMIG
jgi:hypothetical protein